jgi:hypothetical protein
MGLRSGALADAAFFPFLGASLVQAADPSKPVDLAAGEAIYKDVYDMNQIRDVSEYITSVMTKAAGASK